jgi:hypothetical protein
VGTEIEKLVNSIHQSALKFDLGENLARLKVSYSGLSQDSYDEQACPRPLSYLTCLSEASPAWLSQAFLMLEMLAPPFYLWQAVPSLSCLTGLSQALSAWHACPSQTCLTGLSQALSAYQACPNLSYLAGLLKPHPPDVPVPGLSYLTLTSIMKTNFNS